MLLFGHLPVPSFDGDFFFCECKLRFACTLGVLTTTMKLHRKKENPPPLPILLN